MYKNLHRTETRILAGPEQRRAFDLRREREIGNWGYASEHIGKRWEALGYQKLLERLCPDSLWPSHHPRPSSAVPLIHDEAIQGSLSSVGLPSPDVVLVIEADRSNLLQPLDFKWDLEFASYEQIRGSVLRTLLERDKGPLGRAISDLAHENTDGCFRDGLFFAPDSPANRAFMLSTANARREFPVERAEVIFEDVEPEEFFSSLPGWEMALVLSQLDRVPQVVEVLDGADRYYRLGAGLLGAVAQLQSTVFDTRPAMPGAASAMDWLRPRVTSLSSTCLIQEVQRLMTVRSQNVARVRRLTRCPYRPADLARGLSRRGFRLPDSTAVGEAMHEREKWMLVVRRVAVEYKATILRSGLRMVKDGLTDEDALARLEADGRRFATAVETLAERLIEAVTNGQSGQSASR